jgi:Arc/MetJ-type ribon-helix-helix transcriptional regulator
MKNKAIATWVPETLEQEIQELIDQGRYTNKADFIRTAVREKLEKEA